MKVLSIIGARPQFIKLAPLDKGLRLNNEHIIVHTGQHYDLNMSDVFFEDLKISSPDYNLEVGSASSSKQTASIIKSIESVFLNEKPDLTIVYGDTNSTVAGALVSVQNHIPVAHVEAGPRNNKIDIPEMLNRIITDRISSLLLCATENNVDTLKNEGMGDRAFFVGDLMYDVFLKMKEKIADRKNILSKLGLEEKNYALVTCHRAENTDSPERLKIIIEALIESEKKIVFSLHPRTKKMIENFNLNSLISNNENIMLLNPLGYKDFLILSMYSEKIITDSGGLQREAYFLEKPCICLYDHAYWPEIEEDGWQVVTGINKHNIVNSINNFNPNTKPSQIFGDGNSSEKIIKAINEFNFKTAFDY